MKSLEDALVKKVVELRKEAEAEGLNIPSNAWFNGIGTVRHYLHHMWPTFITFSLQEEFMISFYKDERHLHFYFEGEEGNGSYLKSWGPDIWNDMEDGSIDEMIIPEVDALFSWLLGEKISTV